MTSDEQDDNILHEFMKWCDENLKPLEHRTIGLKEWDELITRAELELFRLTDGDAHNTSFSCGIAAGFRLLQLRTV